MLSCTSVVIFIIGRSWMNTRRGSLTVNYSSCVRMMTPRMCSLIFWYQIDAGAM